MAPRGPARLLIVSESLGGGLGAAVRAQVEYFTASGWEVRVGVPLAARHQAPDLAGCIVDVAIPASIRDLRGAARAAHDLRGVLAAGSADIVHCHGIRSFVVARCIARVPASVTWHGSRSLAGEPKWARLLRRPAHRITAALAQEAIAAGPGFGAGWTFLPHASPRLGGFEQVPPMVDEFAGPARFVFVGRLAEPKRVEMFVEAVALASRRVPVEGVVVGDGPLERALRDLVERLGAPVELLGHRDDVGAIIAAGRASVLTTGFEAAAFAAQEAMWIGRGVVASPIPALEWLVGDAGRFADSAEDLADALVELADPALAAELGERAARRVRRLIEVDAPWPEVERRFRSRVVTQLTNDAE